MQANTWFDALYQCQQQGRAYVLATVLTHAGSTPRDSGSKMIITDDAQYDTIGGGHLEYEVVKTSRAMLIENKSVHKTISYPLSSSLGQCCGGAVKVLYEVMVNHQQHIAIFGAGHVAQSLVPMLAQLPLQIRWIDSRKALFDTLPEHVDSVIKQYSNVHKIYNDEPCEEIERLPENSWILILTHNHQLDYELVESSLKRADFGFIGMIGSATKAKRFRTKLAHREFKSDQIQRLISPIGDLTVPGKLPVEVSISICTQIVRLMHKSDDTEQSSVTTKHNVTTNHPSDNTRLAQGSASTATGMSAGLDAAMDKGMGAGKNRDTLTGIRTGKNNDD